MHLTSLTLTNFRKFSNLTLDFPEDRKLICFVGPNTVGKTNILEAIYFLGLLRSFRAGEALEMLKWESESLEVKGAFTREEEEIRLQINMIFQPKKQKKLRINNAETILTDYVGTLNVVFFSPDDINLLLLSPANRRKYLDTLLSQTDREYLRALVHYQKTIKQRNALLKRIVGGHANEHELSFWDNELATSGTLITKKRAELLTFLTPLVSKSYQEISKNNEGTFTLEYLPSFKDESHDVEQFKKTLMDRLQRDLAVESTSFGPHRDDFAFLLDSKNIETFASRGDTRSMILAVKLSEISYIEKKKGTLPLLLLDDVFSELDNARQAQLVDHIPEHVQTFITTTSQDIGAGKNFSKDIYFVEME